MIYILSCETPGNGGGIYGCDLGPDGSLSVRVYYPCDRPMYAARRGRELCVLLRSPFPGSDEGGYFFIGEELSGAGAVRGTGGRVPCHLALSGDDVFAVNYLSGNLVKNGETAVERTGCGPNASRQSSPHTHFVGKTPDGYLAVCDLGCDELAIYDTELRQTGSAQVPPGNGIRHIVFSRGGDRIYAVNELIPSVSVFGYSDGTVSYKLTVPIECKAPRANGAAIRLSEGGGLLYVSLREENAICVFEADGERLNLLQKTSCRGDSPRDFGLFGEFLVCCNEKSGVSVLRLKDGLIIGEAGSLKIPATLCVL